MESSLSETSLNSEELQCAVCLDQFKKPKLLSCFHTFCHDCLDRCVKNGRIACPSCRRETKVPDGGTDLLQTNYIAGRKLDALDFLNKSTSDTTQCDNCDDDEAICFCQKCSQFLCELCSSVHRRARLSKNHSLSSLKEAKVLGQSEVVTCMKPRLCPLHEDEVLKLYCETCETVICRDCIVEEHKGHNYVAISNKITEASRDELSEAYVEAKEISEELESAIGNIQATINKTRNRQREVKENIKQKFEEIIQILQNRKNMLCDEIDRIAESKIENLEDQICKSPMVANTISFVEELIVGGDDVEVLGMKKHVRERMGAMFDTAADISPIEGDKINFSFELADEMKVLFQNLGSVDGKCFVAEHCDIDSEKEECSFGDTLPFTVITKTDEGMVCGSQFDQVEVYLEEQKSPSNGSSCHPYRMCCKGNKRLCEVEHVGSGVLKVVSSPLACMTDYLIEVDVNGKNGVCRRLEWQAADKNFKFV